jgi:cell division protein ZapA (FtsZ GTPase activity inhibitor)
MTTEVIIFDKIYKFECTPNEEANLHSAAQALEKKYRETRLAMPRLESERVTGMVAFNLSLEYSKLEQQFKILSEQVAKEKSQSEQLIQQLTLEVKKALQAG